MPIGFVCGFKAEQRIAARTGALTAIAWRNPDATAALIAQGATILVSFGVAGAIDPALRAGDLLIPAEIILPDRSCIGLSPVHVARLRGVFPRARVAALFASAAIVATNYHKQSLFDEIGAGAVDMETSAMVQTGLEAGIPCVVVRAIADEATDGLPPAALVGLRDNGSIDAGAVARSILGNPRQIPALMRTGRLTSKALATLEEAAPLLAAALQ